MSVRPDSTDLENPKIDLKTIDKLNLSKSDVTEIPTGQIASEHGEWKEDARDVYAEGHNGHIVGDWWPNTLAYQRDKAHASILRGIGGKAGMGAVSIVVGSGDDKKGYANIDNGNTLEYCGDDTNLMDLSFEKGTWI